MRYSQLLIPTVKEVPAEAEVPSHQLMIRAGFIRKLASGTYTYLPLGWRSLKKIIEIVRREMDAAGAQEILMPVLQPMELWQKTGRNVVFADIMCKFTDRHGRENVLAPTAEEVVTALAAGELKSYKQLPVNLYQVNTKFRDEFRPRFGVLRSREFIMKDAYSFDIDAEGLDESYRKMYDAYRRIFDRCGLKYVIVQADSGGMGGTDTEEFMIPCSAGEDIIVHTEDDSYSANIEKAEVDPPPKNTEPRSDAKMEEILTPGVGTIDAVCEFLAAKPQDMIKTLIYSTSNAEDEKVIAALVRGGHEINESKLKEALGVESIELASEEQIRHATGASVGFAGPVGINEVMLVIDHSIAAMSVGVTGANKTDYHVKNVVPGRDFPLEGDNVIVADIRNAVEGDTYQGKSLVFDRGVEVGHIFKLGTKYSEMLGATVLDENGKECACLMGCYGIGINRILAAAIETSFDDNGCVLPANIAPFEIEILPLNTKSQAVMDEAQRIYDELKSAGADVLLDDRTVRPGVKFKDADLIGIPLRIVVGDRGLKEGNVEVKRRTDEEPTLVPAADAVGTALKILDEMKD